MLTKSLREIIDTEVTELNINQEEYLREVMEETLPEDAIQGTLDGIISLITDKYNNPEEVADIIYDTGLKTDFQQAKYIILKSLGGQNETTRTRR